MERRELAGDADRGGDLFTVGRPALPADVEVHAATQVVLERRESGSISIQAAEHDPKFNTNTCWRNALLDARVLPNTHEAYRIFLDIQEAVGVEVSP